MTRNKLYLMSIVVRILRQVGQQEQQKPCIGPVVFNLEVATVAEKRRATIVSILGGATYLARPLNLTRLIVA